MKYFLLIISVFYAVSVYGNDFRGLKFGDSCQDLREQESANDSEFVELQSLEYAIFDNYKFKGECYNHTANITYECTKKDQFVRGQCIVDAGNQEQAEYIYYDIRKEIVAESNEPLLENRDSTISDLLSSFWSNTERTISLILLGSDERYSVAITKHSKKEYEIKDGIYRKGFRRYKK